MNHSLSNSSITPKPSNKGNKGVTNSTDTLCLNPSAGAMEVLKQGDESPTNDEPEDEESEPPENQLGLPENYAAYYGHCE